MRTLPAARVYIILIVMLSLALLFEGYRWISDNASLRKLEEGLYTDQITWIPKKNPYSLAKGYQLLNEGHGKEALPHLVYALKKEPHNPTLLMETAALFCTLGKKDVAFRLLLQAYKVGDPVVKQKSLNLMMDVVPEAFEGGQNPDLIVGSLLYKNERKEEAIPFLKKVK